MPEKTDSGKFLNRAKYWCVAFTVSVFVLVVFASIGQFIIITLSGLSASMLFLAIYNFVLYSQAKRSFSFAKSKKETKESGKLKEYINYHLPLVISLLLIGLLIALIVLFWVT